MIPVIEFQHVSKKYGDQVVVDDLNFTVNAGEIFVLVGPSGSGKTTTLKMINQLIEKTEGDIFIQGKVSEDYDIHELRWNIGYVLQQIALFPNMTVAENIAIVPQMKEWSKDKIDNRVDELLEMVRLDPKEYRDRSISELSGGQQQRVGVARALAADPDMLLMDEPFSALDPISRFGLQEDLVDLQQNLNKTIVFVTHDMQEATRIGDRICIMNQGRVEQLGTPEEILNQPKTQFVKDFIKRGLPDYQEQQSLGDLIDQGFASLINEKVSPDLTESDNLDSALDYLAEKPKLFVSFKGQTYQVTQTDYLKFLKANQGKAGEA